VSSYIIVFIYDCSLTQFS